MHDVIDTSPAELRDLPMREIEDIQIEDPRAISHLLQTVMRRGTPFVIHESGGTSHTAQMWAVDTKKQIISFAENVFSLKMHQVAEADAAVALCYVDNVKIQFDLFDRFLVRGTQGSVLQAAMPRDLLQFRRRASYRIRPEGVTAPKVRLVHPHVGSGPIELDILDISDQGCGLLMPTALQTVRRGYVFNHAFLQLDDEVKISVNLTVRRQAFIASRVPTILIGCQMEVSTHQEKNQLQKYLTSIQKISRAIS